MSAAGLLLLSASEQARRITRGELSREQLVAAQRAAIASRNPQLNAFVQVVEEPSDPDATSPLAGTTFAVKDNIDAAGLPSHCGLKALHAQPAAADAPVVERLRGAGLTFLGKLNMHAMALGATSHNRDFGDCRNPARTTHTPGGSSGGSAAAVAVGLCSIALGTDTMGSVRVPASYCGVVGFKPSFEALTTQGVAPLSRLLDHVGILARSVEDIAHAFEVLRIAPPGEVPPALPTKPQGWKIAVPSNEEALGADPDVLEAFRSALGTLERAGFKLQPVPIPVDRFSPVRRAGLLLSEAELGVLLADVLAARRGEVPADLLAMLDWAAGRSATDLARSLARMLDLAQWVTRTLEPLDALLLPTTPQTAFAMDAPVPHNQADFTVLGNLAGAPAISLPLPVAPGALPIGLQAIGRRGADLALLGLAGALESALAC